MIRTRSIYTAAILDCLQQAGRPIKPQDAYNWIIQHGLADARDLEIIQTDGGTRFHKEVRWARKNLFDAELLSAPEYGLWDLTDEGRALKLSPDTAGKVVREIIRKVKKRRAEAAAQIDTALEGGHRPNSAVGGPTVGPTPSDWSGAISRSASIPAATYLVRFGQRNIWKIGQTTDVASRLADLKRHVPEEVLEENWALVRARTWPTALKAFEIEQALFAALADFRSSGERVICSEAEALNAWEALCSKLE